MEKINVLFLDIDGVVNSAETIKRNYLRNGVGRVAGIDPELAFVVGKIILETGCKVVISSSWRHFSNGIEEIKQRVYPEIYGQTPHSRTGFRGDEINMWLAEHPEVERYAILDDDSDFHKDQHLFKTSWETGITYDIAMSVIAYLKGDTKHVDSNGV